MLKVNHIQKNYSHFNLNCSFDVPKGTITGIIGKPGFSGAPVSTGSGSFTGCVDGEVSGSCDGSRVGSGAGVGLFDVSGAGFGTGTTGFVGFGVTDGIGIPGIGT